MIRTTSTNMEDIQNIVLIINSTDRDVDSYKYYLLIRDN